ncbi:MAG TPA: chemotaxis protein CheW, partial [Leptospiraceae bacterium]|nr:chemotaxis protein CheW [Leptospiraceae bacterium]
RLNRIIGLSARPDVEEFPVVIVNYNTRKLGFIVDDLIGKHETVIKTLEKNFRNIPGLTGASIMGDGTIILVLDIPGLIELSTGSLPDITSLGGKDMPRTNSARSIDSTSLALVYKTANSTNMYNSKLLEMVQSDKSKRKKEKSKQVKKAVIQERDEDIPLQLSSVQSKQEEEKTEETAPEQEVQVQEETSVHSESVTPEESSDSTISDDEHAKAKELLKSFAEQTHERVESMIDRGEVIDHSLSKAEIRKLESVVNTGMMNAGLVLSQLVGSNVELFMPEITLADKDSLALEIRDPDDLFFGLKVGMNGDLHGAMLMIFSEEKGRELASKLLK